MSHIHGQIQSQILSNNLDCTYHLRVLVFLFFLLLSCNGVMVYLGCCRMVCIAHMGDSNCYCVVQLWIFFSTDLPSFAFFLLCFLSVSIPIFILPIGIFCFQFQDRLCTDGPLRSPFSQFL